MYAEGPHPNEQDLYNTGVYHLLQYNTKRKGEASTGTLSENDTQPDLENQLESPLTSHNPPVPVTSRTPEMTSEMSMTSATSPVMSEMRELPVLPVSSDVSPEPSTPMISKLTSMWSVAVTTSVLPEVAMSPQRSDVQAREREGVKHCSPADQVDTWLRHPGNCSRYFVCSGGQVCTSTVVLLFLLLWLWLWLFLVLLLA